MTQTANHSKPLQVTIKTVVVKGESWTFILPVRTDSVREDETRGQIIKDAQEILETLDRKEPATEQLTILLEAALQDEAFYEKVMAKLAGMGFSVDNLLETKPENIDTA